jgi:hypothetical protein
MSGDHNMNQKPVAWFHADNYKTRFTTDPSQDMIGRYWQPLYTAPLTVSMQEPVGEVLNERGEVDYISYIPPVGTPLYTAPRQWVGLTDEEIEDEWERVTGHSIFGGNRSDGRTMFLSPDEVVHYTQSIEAKLKEKNG